MIVLSGTASVRRSSTRSPIERMKWALIMCEERRLRVTPARRSILNFLVKQKLPVSLEAIKKALQNRGERDFATVFRAMNLFEKAGIVRRINLPSRHSFYVIVAPSEHRDYLICEDCGSISRLTVEMSFMELEQRIASQSGFRRVRHELEFYGMCPDCQKDHKRKRKCIGSPDS
jgi:Fur family transcriptional regulator, ferric uptake regulator